MEKSQRPQRIRRHSRRAWPPEDDLHHSLRAAKRLFTPEIKRMLKDWLIRRRENPYPSRDEKKRLAIETGLTYTQICNWFANWRRKLKNSEREKVKKSWGHLIKHYNTNARGNVEQFSISSEDSIWEEQEHAGELRPSESDMDEEELEGDGYVEGAIVNSNFNGRGNERQYYETYYKPCENQLQAIKLENENNYYATENQQNLHDYQMNTATHEMLKNELGYSNMDSDNNYNMNISNRRAFPCNKAKYKQKMMEKYWRDIKQVEELENHEMEKADLEHELHESVLQQSVPTTSSGTAELTKWLESAAKFTPNKNNYYIEWNNQRNKLDGKQMRLKTLTHSTINPVATANPTSLQEYHHQLQPTSATHIYSTIHQKDELEAAEALANFAFNCRQRMLETTTNLQTAINA